MWLLAAASVPCCLLAGGLHSLSPGRPDTYLSVLNTWQLTLRRVSDPSILLGESHSVFFMAKSPKTRIITSPLLY